MMSWRMGMLILQMALQSVRRHALRAMLTALGMLIGVAAVIFMVSLGNGAQDKIEQRVASLGQNILMVFAGSQRNNGVNAGQGSARTLVLGDVEAIEHEIAGVVAVSPEISANMQALANGRNWSTSVIGVSPDYLNIRNWNLARGNMFSDMELRAADKVAVIATKTATELFGPIDPIGQTVRLKNIPFIIIGLLEEKGAGVGGQNQDDRILIPYSTAMKRLTGEKRLRSIQIQVDQADRMLKVQEEITALLRQRHRLSEGQRDDFSIVNQKEIVDVVVSVSGWVKLLLAIVAGISLFVGGIGIMNMMLVSVTERTREIGIRLAVGARPRSIMIQFMLESLVLSLFGGFLGVVAGVGGSQLVIWMFDFNALVSMPVVLLAFGVSVAIGLFFGIYPARRAARLNPIAALRFE